MCYWTLKGVTHNPEAVCKRVKGFFSSSSNKVKKHTFHNLLQLDRERLCLAFSFDVGRRVQEMPLCGGMCFEVLIFYFTTTICKVCPIKQPHTCGKLPRAMSNHFPYNHNSQVQKKSLTMVEIRGCLKRNLYTNQYFKPFSTKKSKVQKKNLFK